MGSIFGLLAGVCIGFMFGISYYRARGIRQDIDHGLSHTDEITGEQKVIVRRLIIEKMSGGSILERLLRK